MFKQLSIVLLLLCALSLASAQTAQWLTVYWGSWTLFNSPPVGPKNLPIRTVGTHWVWFNVGLTFTASESTYFGPRSKTNTDMVYAKEFTDTVHAAGKKAIMSIGPGD
jgi:hypothetical protein